MRFIPLASLAPLLLVVSPLRGQQADTLARLDSLYARFRGEGPGCAVGIGRDGVPNIERAYGLASLEYGIPISRSTVFHTASVAKQFTAAAVILLARDGKVSLDDDVRRYVPELPVYGSRITVGHLLHHTSGIRDQEELLWLAGGRDDDPLEDEDVLGPIIRQRQLNFVPGSQYLYSNSNYTLLALVVQRVTGKTLKAFAAQELFEPLGMAHTQFVDNRFAVVPNVATGYRGLQGGSWGHVAYLSDVYGASGLFTTVGDLLAWYSQLEAQSNLTRALYRAALTPGRLNNGDSIAYSSGLELGSYRGARFIGHSGNSLGESAYAMRFVDRGMTVAVLCNGKEIDAGTLARQSAALFLAAPASITPRATESASTVALGQERLNELGGLYYNAALLTTRTVESRDGRLYWVRGGPGTPLDAVSSNRFRFPPGQPVELLFPARRPPEPQELQVISGASVTTYQRAEPFVRSKRPGEYSGHFRSDEIDVTLTIAQRDSSITISTLGSWRFEAIPLFRDAFAVPEAAVFEFRRTNGRVTGLVVDMPRSRHMVFSKLPK